MIDRAKKLVDLALKLGASEAEVYASSGKVVNVETVRGDLGYGEESISEGLGVRVIASRAEGYSSSNDPARFEAAVKAAIECARARPADPDLKGLPKPKAYRNVRGIFDERVHTIDRRHQAQSCTGYRTALQEFATRGFHAFTASAARWIAFRMR
jgi:PmbA protein